MYKITLYDAKGSGVVNIYGFDIKAATWQNKKIFDERIVEEHRSYCVI